MKKIFFAFAVLILSKFQAQTWKNDEQYIQRFAAYAVEEMEKYNYNIMLNQDLFFTYKYTLRFLLINKYGNWKKYLDTEHNGWKKIKGFQLRYIYLIDKTCKITVPILPFSKIDEMGAGMYKGKKITLAERKNKE